MPAIHEVAAITSKGQITLPKPIRQALGVDYGGKVEFDLRGTQNIVTRADEPPFMRIKPSAHFWHCWKKTSARASTCVPCQMTWCRPC
jgi:AbrB family looped-hinge helix DNA binding protein